MVVRTKGCAPSHGHGGQGLCQRCYNRRRHDRLRDPSRPRQWRALDLLAEYEFWLAHGLTTKRQVAERVGVPFKTLDRAISRGRAYRRQAAEAESAAVGVIESEAA